MIVRRHAEPSDAVDVRAVAAVDAPIISDRSFGRAVPVPLRQRLARPDRPSRVQPEPEAPLAVGALGVEAAVLLDVVRMGKDRQVAMVPVGVPEHNAPPRVAGARLRDHARAHVRLDADAARDVGVVRHRGPIVIHVRQSPVEGVWCERRDRDAVAERVGAEIDPVIDRPRLGHVRPDVEAGELPVFVVVREHDDVWRVRGRDGRYARRRPGEGVRAAVADVGRPTAEPLVLRAHVVRDAQPVVTRRERHRVGLAVRAALSVSRHAPGNADARRVQRDLAAVWDRDAVAVVPTAHLAQVAP